MTVKTAGSFLVFSISLMAPVFADAAGYSGPRTIGSFMAQNQWFATAYPTAAFDNPDGCGNSWMAMIRNDAGYKDLMAALMVAQVTGQQVNFWFIGCESTPWGYTIPIVYSIKVG